MKGDWIRKPTDRASVVFVHGILSSGDACWRHSDGTYWPDLLADEPDLKSIGIYVFTYRTDVFSGSYSLSDTVDALKEQMRLDSVLDSDRIIFVCHSMGGIVVRKFLVERQADFVNSGKAFGLFLVASPSLGASYADWLSPLVALMGHSQSKVLRFVRNNEWLMDLDKEFTNLKEARTLDLSGKELVEDKPPILSKLWRRPVVESFSGARYFGEPVKVPDSDHFSIAKPSDRNAFQHRLLVEFIKSCLAAKRVKKREARQRKSLRGTRITSGPVLPQLQDIIGFSNRAALSLYEEYVRDEPPNDQAAFDRPREIVAGGYWNTPEYTAQRNYVPVRRLETPEFILQKTLQLLAKGFSIGADTHVWLIGEGGTGKTTAMYRIYFEILEARRRAEQESAMMPYPIPVLIQLQRVHERLIEKLSGTKDEFDFIAATFDIWLRRRHFQVAERDMPSLQAEFYKALRRGDIMLLVDSYDELGRMAVELELFEHLFSAAKHYVAATRRELYRERRDHQPLSIQPTWDIPTIHDYLERIFSAWTDLASGLAAFIERHDNIRWLRNPRYLDLLKSHVSRRLDSGDVSAAEVLATIEQGQYGLLRALYDATVERMRAIWPTDSPAAENGFERALRRHLQTIALSQVETGSLAVAVGDADAIWDALARHASEIVCRRTDYTSPDDQFSLVSYDWIDFFLVDVVLHELLEEPPSKPLRLRHLWTQTLLLYTAECATARGEIAKLAQRIRARLSFLRLGAALSGPKTIRSNEAVNLVQFLVHLLSQLDPAKRGKIDVQEHVEFVDEDFSGLDLDSVDLHRLSFRRCDFSRAQLTESNLQRSVFERCDFSQADLRRADADHAVFIDCTFPLAGEPAKEESRVAGMWIQGALIKSNGEDLIQRLHKEGAVVQRSRYRSPFGKLFFERQQQMLGSGLVRAENRYLAEIASVLRSVNRDRKQLIDLMAGGGNRRLIELLQSDPGLFVLAIDRDGRDMNEIVTKVGERFAFVETEIDGGTDLRALAADYFDPPLADVAVGKKALHELPRDAQPALIRSVANALRPHGRFVVFADSPYEIDKAGQERLSRLRETIVTYADPDLEPLRAELLALRFDPTSPSELAVFSNFWVHLKDWANGNERELRNRYFSGAHEIIEWSAAAGLRQMGQTYSDCYQLVARRFNENGYNLACHRLEESNQEIHPRDVAFYREVLEGTDRFRLFCEVVEHHLWDAGGARPTPLGVVLNATRRPLDLHGLHPNLRTESIGLSYDSGIGFDFTIHVLTFEKHDT